MARRCCGPTTACRARDDAALHKDLKLPHAQLIVRKGYHKDMDSYSAFDEADHKTTTGLAGYLKARGIKRVFVTGLATDFCVAWTAMDARTAGLRGLRDRGRDARHRPERLAGRGLEADGAPRASSASSPPTSRWHEFTVTGVEHEHPTHRVQVLGPDRPSAAPGLPAPRRHLPADRPGLAVDGGAVRRAVYRARWRRVRDRRHRQGHGDRGGLGARHRRAAEVAQAARRGSPAR